MSVIHAPRRPVLDGRQLAFLAVVGCALFGLFLRLWYLQVVSAEDLADKASALRTVAVKRLAPRGLIFDRNGVLIAGIEPKWVVLAQPYEVKRNPWVIEKLALLLGTDPAELWEKVKANEWRPHFPAAIHVGASIEVATKIAESGDYLPGIDIDTQPMRAYVDTANYSHLLGYVWTPSAEDVERLKEKGADIPDYVGKNGLERVYELELQGKRGLDRFEVDNKRRPKRAVERRAPQPGKRLFLSIDDAMQKQATELMKGAKGAVVVLKPESGEVLALVSSPTFDTQLFEGGVSKTDFARLRDDKNFPLMNRAAAARYPPGSTFKIVTTSAWALAGKFDLHRPIFCPGYHTMGNRKTKCLGVHGAVAFHRAFEKSCNTYFATIGVEAGIENLRRASKMFHLGSKTGIDLPSETAGRIPYEEWIAANKLPWYPGDTVNMAIGQGYVETSPLQMACIGAAVANQGKVYRPTLLHAVAEAGSNNAKTVSGSELIANFELPAEVWRALRESMVSVIESGTAFSARIPGLAWGGKTGSSEHRKGAETHSWFLGIAPMDRPELVIAIVLEAKGHGGDVAAPIAKQIVASYFARLAKSRSAAENTASASSNSAESPPVP